MRVIEPTAWVVYRTAAVGTSVSRNAVCSQPEWDAMELARPGHHTLIREHITNEGEAERLARDMQTAAEPPKSSKPSSYSARRLAERAAAAAAPPPAPTAAE